MNKAQDPIKLSTPPFKVEDYYTSDSSSPSLKQVFQLETKVESSKTVVMPVMTIGTSNLEEEMAAMKAMLERLVKESEEKEAHIELQEEKIAILTRKPEKRPARSLEQSSESDKEEKTFVQSEASDEKVHSKKGGKLNNDGSPNLMTVEQIQDLIANIVTAELGGGACKTHLYTKPYTKRVGALYMPRGYQHLKFQKFDGKGNPKRHVAHFIEACNNIGTDDDLMIKQFVRILKGIAFNWYTDFEPETIDSWGQMEQEFLNRVYST